MSAEFEVTLEPMGPWVQHTTTGSQAEIPHWDAVEPMVRGVWNMAQDARRRQIIQVWGNPWFQEFMAKALQTEQRADSGDNWATLGSRLDEYFYADGFDGLAYGLHHVQKFLRDKGEFVFVDWMATPTAIRSADYIGDGLELGISVGLGAHAPDVELDALATARNIHHITGSILDPAVHASMLEKLNGRTIDLFTARPKGGMDLLPTTPSLTSMNYYHRMFNFIYNRLSPGGFMFVETPQRGEDFSGWCTATSVWVDMLQEEGLDADSGSGGIVARKAEGGHRLSRLGHQRLSSLYGPELTYLEERGFAITGMELSDEEYAKLVIKRAPEKRPF